MINCQSLSLKLIKPNVVCSFRQSMDIGMKTHHLPVVQCLCGRFRVGTGGIYVGAKDLNVSDMSGGFSLSVESVKQSDRSAVIKMHMGGREPRPPPLTVTETDRFVHLALPMLTWICSVMMDLWSCCPRM